MQKPKSFIETCLEAYQERTFLQAYNETFELVRADTAKQKEMVLLIHGHFLLEVRVLCGLLKIGINTIFTLIVQVVSQLRLAIFVGLKSSTPFS